MIVKLAVELYPWNPTTKTWGSKIDVLDAFDTTANQSLGEMNDTWSFKVNNSRNAYASYFNSLDNVKIYLLKNGEAVDSSNMIMSGLLKTITEDSTNAQKVLRIEGKSFGEITTNALVFVKELDSHTDNVFQFIEKAVQSIEIRDSNFGITGVKVNGVSVASATKLDGSPFPILNDGDAVRAYDKSLSFIMTNYLTADNTGDGTYYWFIDNNRTLHMNRRFNSATKATWTEGVDFKTCRTRKNTEDIKNYIIVKCGNDLDGNPITTRYDDYASRAKNGFKYYMIVDTQIAKDIIIKYPNYTNEQVRTAAKAVGKARGEAFAKLHADGLLEISVSKEPTHDYAIGDKIVVNIPSYNLSNKELRIKSINWDIDSTDITLTEEVLK